MGLFHLNSLYIEEVSNSFTKQEIGTLWLQSRYKFILSLYFCTQDISMKSIQLLVQKPMNRVGSIITVIINAHSIFEDRKNIDKLALLC